MRDIFQATAHEALGGHDGISGIDRLHGLGTVTNVGVTRRQVAHDGRQQGTTVFIIKHFGYPVTNCRNQRIGRTKIDTYR